MEHYLCCKCGEENLQEFAFHGATFKFVPAHSDSRYEASYLCFNVGGVSYTKEIKQKMPSSLQDLSPDMKSGL